MAKAAEKKPVNPQDYLDMSDEDISNMDYTSFQQANNSDDSDQSDATSDNDESNESQEPVKQPEDDAGTSQSGGSLGPEGVPKDGERTSAGSARSEAAAPSSDPWTKKSQGAEDLSDVGESPASSTDSPESSELDESGEVEELEAGQTSTGIDYKAEYERLLAPFRANGKDMQVDNVDDARQLMQMGANYNKKMAALKPSLRVLKTLENNDLLDPEKVNFLVDLVSKRKPEAVAKFLKDSGIDPLELDTSEDTEYRPESHTVSDKELELDQVLDEIRETESFQRTVDELTKKWDQASKQVLLDNPRLIAVINGHVGNGIYDQIMDIVDRERTLGRLQGVSDLEAYRQVGDAIQAKGGFNAPQRPEPKPQPVADQDPKTKSRKRAAAPTKGNASRGANTNFNPLSLSDEEFEKMAGSKFI